MTYISIVHYCKENYEQLCKYNLNTISIKNRQVSLIHVHLYLIIYTKTLA
jgi:hypothetical protein